MRWGVSRVNCSIRHFTAVSSLRKQGPNWKSAPLMRWVPGQARDDTVWVLPGMLQPKREIL
jgi:hypothetical protein